MDNIMIQTPRLVLRSFEPSDAPALLELLAHPRVNCFADQTITTLDEALARIDAMPWHDLAVCRREDGAFVGMLFGEEEPPDAFSPCWNFLPQYGGQGYAYEAAAAYFDCLFSTGGCRRLFAYTEEDNLPSQALCRRLGMRHEGTFLEFISFVNAPDGSPIYENTMQFAILKREWEHRAP